jgi:hypothetical protein
MEAWESRRVNDDRGEGSIRAPLIAVFKDMNAAKY